MQRKHRAGDDGDAEYGSDHGSVKDSTGSPSSWSSARSSRALRCAPRPQPNRTSPRRGSRCRPQPSAQCLVVRSRRTSSARARRCRQTAGRFPVDDDVGCAAGVHRRDRHAERAGLEQHAAEAFRAARREDQHRRVRQPRHGRWPIDPADETDVACATCRARASICARSGPSPAMTSGQSRSACSTTSDQVRCALVRRELAEIERVRVRQRWRGRGRVRAQAVDVDGVGDDFERVSRELGRARTKVGGDRRADGDDRVGPRKAACACAQVRAHVRNHRQRQPATARRRAAGCSASSSRPSTRGTATRTSFDVDRDRTSSRPASSRAPCRRPGYRADAPPRSTGSDVSTCWPCTRSTRSRAMTSRETVGEARVEPLVLEVVADVRQRPAPARRTRGLECRRTRARGCRRARPAAAARR